MAHFLITGHTGFKGSWLTLLLKSRGHEVSGLALDPAPGSLFDRANLTSELTHDFRVDVRDRDSVLTSFRTAQPDAMIHMAAQALVREGYRNPIGTYETNVNGTLHVLQASDGTDSVTSQLIVTTDKVYRDDSLGRPYVESDPLGGNDPYSASKAMADILAQEMLTNERTKPGVIARAGNVIGAGDESRERLIPDIKRAVSSGAPLIVRYKEAVRPWQHVLDCVAGYVLLLSAVEKKGVKGAWNFGPGAEGFGTVGDVIAIAMERFDFGVTLAPESELVGLSEASYLALDSSKSRESLGWKNQLNLADSTNLALGAAGDLSRGTLREIIADQIEKFELGAYQRQ